MIFERIGRGARRGPEPSGNLTIEKNGLTPAYRQSMEAQGFTYLRDGNEPGGLPGSQIYINPAGEEYLLMPPTNLQKGMPASLYKKSETGAWKKVEGIDIHPMK